MPRYPSPGAYQEAVQHPETAFADPDLQRAYPEEQAWGLPRVITGAFAAVFPMQGEGRRWAVKCFLTEAPEQARRYRVLARHLAAHPLPYMAPFEYQPEGIRVGGAPYPILKMDWVTGTPLNTFVEQHLHDPQVLGALAEAWRALLEALADAGVAHGDLQHGNVLVDAAGGTPRLVLVDYDTMFVPALRGRKSPEIGHRNYQHPDRSEDDFGPYLDRFPGLVIYTALQACRVRPDLWSRYHTGENLLFRAADFYDPAASPLFEVLAREEALAPLVGALRRSCLLEPEAVPTLGDVLDGQGEAARPLRVRRSRSRQRARTTRRRGMARWFAPGVVGGFAATVAAGLGGGAAAGLGAWAVASAVAVATSLRWYRRLPTVRRRRRLQQERAYLSRVLARLQRLIDERTAERETVLARREALKTERLRELREAALHDRLKYHFIDEVRQVDGVTHKVVVRLKAAGIRTAVHVTPERMARVTGVSEASRALVAQWRAGLVQGYTTALPESLSPAEAGRIERYVRYRLKAIDDEVARLREKLAVQQGERALVEERLAQLPRVGYGTALGYLLRLRPLPVQEERRSPPPTPAPPPEARPPVALPAEAERPWWRG